MQTQAFEALQTELVSGTQLIEASAGTGKTYTIALLVLRLILEKNLSISQILVVTYTTAATKELKDRIRQRLITAKQVLNSDSNSDIELSTWLQQLQLDNTNIQQRLDQALANLDQANIFTIHGFCQQILNAYALETGQNFALSLNHDLPAIKEFCSQDFWRQHIYALQPAIASIITAYYDNPTTLLKSLQGLNLHANILPPVTTIKPLCQQFKQLKLLAAQEFPHISKILTDEFATENFKTKLKEQFTQSIQELSAWFADENAILPTLETLFCLSETNLIQSLNGNKFRKTKTISSEERKQNYLDSLELNHTSFNQFEPLLQQISLALRVKLAHELQPRVEAEFQRRNQLSFDDLIHRLAHAIQTNPNLKHILQQRLHVACIDEFQDTDPQQWLIFSNLFAAKHQALYLIGDPKQAIYKFRGADIFCYFNAQKSAQNKFTLSKNWRSHPYLVQAINTLFQRPQAFLFPELEFNPVMAAQKHATGHINTNAPMCLWQLELNPKNKAGYWTNQLATEAIQIAVVNEILSLLSHKFSLSEAQHQRALMPQDIAILVRTNKQAQAYQHVLKQAGIPAIMQQLESVFQSPQAQELYYVLQAILNPNDIKLLKQALSLNWFSLNGNDLHQLTQNETLINTWIARFNHYHNCWLEQDLLCMLQELYATEQVIKHLAKLEQPERAMSNLFQLAELLHQQSIELQLQAQASLSYLADLITQASQQCADTEQLRLESDANAVHILTLHRAKGLEYPVVFCPNLWQEQHNLNSETKLIQASIAGNTITDLGSEQFELHKAQAMREQQAEDLRLAYVALTRAKYRCYLIWVDTGTSKTPNNSSLAYLLDFSQDNFQQQQTKLQNLATKQHEVFAYQLLAANPEITGYFSPKISIPNQLSAKKSKRYLDNNWQISSYTSLDKQVQTPPFKTSTNIEIDLQLELPKGATTGNVLHHLLEFNLFNTLATVTTGINLQRDKICIQHGLVLENPELINQLLANVVNTPLSLDDPEFCLKNLAPQSYSKEMPFYLAIQPLQVSALNNLLLSEPNFQALMPQQLAGYLTGFIDLVCEYRGYYYVIDYKSNYLPNYDAENLALAMQQHNYGLQYWLYSLVLHLYLQENLPNYSYAQHFGGVKYLFVRGMQAEIPASGVYATKPDIETLNKLAQLCCQCN